MRNLKETIVEIFKRKWHSTKFFIAISLNLWCLTELAINMWTISVREEAPLCEQALQNSCQVFWFPTWLLLEGEKGTTAKLCLKISTQF